MAPQAYAIPAPRASIAVAPTGADGAAAGPGFRDFGAPEFRAGIPENRPSPPPKTAIFRPCPELVCPAAPGRV